jgi:hypothetical protein
MSDENMYSVIFWKRWDKNTPLTKEMGDILKRKGAIGKRGGEYCYYNLDDKCVDKHCQRSHVKTIGELLQSIKMKLPCDKKDCDKTDCGQKHKVEIVQSCHEYVTGICSKNHCDCEDKCTNITHCTWPHLDKHHPMSFVGLKIGECDQNIIKQSIRFMRDEDKKKISNQLYQQSIKKIPLIMKLISQYKIEIKRAQNLKYNRSIVSNAKRDPKLCFAKITNPCTTKASLNFNATEFKEGSIKKENPIKAPQEDLKDTIKKEKPIEAPQEDLKDTIKKEKPIEAPQEDLKDTIEIYEKRIGTQECQLIKLKAQLIKNNSQFRKLKTNHRDQIAKRGTQINQLKIEQRDQIAKKDTQINQLKTELAKQKDLLAKKDTQIDTSVYANLSIDQKQGLFTPNMYQEMRDLYELQRMKQLYDLQKSSGQFLQQTHNQIHATLKQYDILSNAPCNDSWQSSR